MPTRSNKLGRGEAPNATLGLDYDLRAFVPFGSLGYLHVHGNKEDEKNELVVIIGLNHDGHGYRAIRVAVELSIAGEIGFYTCSATLIT